MDDRCQIRQHKRFYDALENCCGIDTTYEGQVVTDFNINDFTIYALNEEQMNELLELLRDYDDYRRDITLIRVSTDDGREWHPRYSNNRSLSWVIYGDEYPLIREEDQTGEKIWARFQQALSKVKE